MHNLREEPSLNDISQLLTWYSIYEACFLFVCLFTGMSTFADYLDLYDAESLEVVKAMKQQNDGSFKSDVILGRFSAFSY